MRPPTLTSRSRGTYRDDHGTPEWLIELHREMHGPNIYLDLASDSEANKIVKAQRYYSLADPCPDKPEVDTCDVVWCNPPGPIRNVLKFWRAWSWCISKSARGSFLLYSIDHFRLLAKPPITVWVGFLRKRVRFTGNESQASIASVLISTHHPPGGPKSSVAHWLEW